MNLTADLGWHGPFLGQTAFALHKQLLQRDPTDCDRTVRAWHDHGQRGAPAARELPLQVPHLGHHVHEPEKLLPRPPAPQERDRPRRFGGEHECLQRGGVRARRGRARQRRAIRDILHDRPRDGRSGHYALLLPASTFLYDS